MASPPHYVVNVLTAAGNRGMHLRPDGRWGWPVFSPATSEVLRVLDQRDGFEVALQACTSAASQAPASSTPS